MLYNLISILYTKVVIIWKATFINQAKSEHRLNNLNILAKYYDHMSDNQRAIAKLKLSNYLGVCFMEYKTLTVATTAFEPCEDVRDSANRMIDKINNLKKENQQLDIIIFCELSLNKFIKLIFEEGYLYKCAISLDSQIVLDLKACAKDNNVNLSFGITEEKEGKYYNSQILIDRQGKIACVHRKTNLTAEENLILEKGNSTITFCELEGFTIGTALCYDLIQYKPLKKTQPHLLIHALTDPGEPRFTIGVSGRINNGFYVSANRFGIESHPKGKGTYNGHIGIVSPMGRIVELKHDKENVIIKEIKIALNPSKALMLLRGITSTALICLNVIGHIGKVIDYLRWHLKMKRQKKHG